MAPALPLLSMMAVLGATAGADVWCRTDAECRTFGDTQAGCGDTGLCACSSPSDASSLCMRPAVPAYNISEMRDATAVFVFPTIYCPAWQLYDANIQAFREAVLGAGVTIHSLYIFCGSLVAVAHFATRAQQMETSIFSLRSAVLAQKARDRHLKDAAMQMSVSTSNLQCDVVGAVKTVVAENHCFPVQCAGGYQREESPDPRRRFFCGKTVAAAQEEESHGNPNSSMPLSDTQLVLLVFFGSFLLLLLCLLVCFLVRRRRRARLVTGKSLEDPQEVTTHTATVSSMEFDSVSAEKELRAMTKSYEKSVRAAQHGKGVSGKGSQERGAGGAGGGGGPPKLRPFPSDPRKLRPDGVGKKSSRDSYAV